VRLTLPFSTKTICFAALTMARSRTATQPSLAQLHRLYGSASRSPPLSRYQQSAYSGMNFPESWAMNANLQVSTSV
jgi:hypothetical protein